MRRATIVPNKCVHWDKPNQLAPCLHCLTCKSGGPDRLDIVDGLVARAINAVRPVLIDYVHRAYMRGLRQGEKLAREELAKDPHPPSDSPKKS